jgi:hypothetical protein
VSRRAWPHLPVDLTGVAWNDLRVDLGDFAATPPNLCKHEHGACEACGTTERRDAVHVTRGDKGRVGRIRR